MTLAANHRVSGPVEAPVEPPRVVRQRRMRPGLLGLAVLLIALGGLGAAFAVTSVRATGTYLAVARPVSVGTELTADDVRSVQVAGGVGLALVSADKINEVIGKRAAVTLVPDTLITMEQLTDKPLLGPGQQQVAIGLKPNQVPAKSLRPGDKVLLVSTPPQNSSTTGEPRATQTTRYEATVVDAAEPDDKGPDRTTFVIYLALASRDAPAVVTLAAQNRLAVILTGAA
ncbi:SAF domain-containing protein [Phytohabitans kaempferiae]|uniref:SAF domain-containing protein n=1 Tax=Phytohabitans kaempferiae TaxID=1620943 RepID=A0ABV6LUW0_9ACTN